ncbi:SNF2 helicase associated domain-containing protein [Verrucomicrobiaceae bacterium 5K15]|uniref:SNF2 helicase associated domain-containing protein n=1 Tax=Oceaniferula flava TaxID=2800421 RepID=A0AAE2SCS0_9BACT|nr:SNF2-related protein [Oceaniferula flavus]MBK1855473.1 SNF2 helicase associated domain-containing protein [Oceaniferula flavus]MBM1136779.1 SNF2 helicase associated domain-containing protein [Oceaniferula flavus]
MEITEQWIGQAAGGRVFKEARSLVKLGKVSQVKRSEDVFQGTFQQGRKPMRVVVKVLGPHHVKNLCPCSVSRATGGMCEHATAVLLAAVTDLAPEKKSPAKSSAPASQPMPEMQPLDIRLSPKFPHEGLRAVHLRPADPSTPVQQPDLLLALWLHKQTGQTGAAMLSLQESQLPGFFRAVAGHQRVTRGASAMEIHQATLRPHLEMEINQESGGDTLWLRLADLETGEIFVLGDALAQWDEENARLLIAASQDKNRLGELLSLDDLASGDWMELDTAAFVKRLEAIEKAYQLPADLGGIDLRDASPQIELEIAGSTRALQARLSARYTDAVSVALGLSPEASAFPCRSDDDPNQWLVRNEEHEQEAISRLMGQGFEILDASGFLFLRGEDEVLDFLTVTLPALRKIWTVNTEEKLGRVEERLERIVPQFEMADGGQIASGQDWLACDVTWQCGERTLDGNAVRKLLQSGSRSIKLPGGGKAVISQFDTEVMDGVLLDADPKQENGRYYFPPNQVGYLKRLNNYYQAADGKSAEPEVDVPALPDDLEQTLRSYQKDGVQWLYRRAQGEGAALLADDMGLGKTLQTLAFLKLWQGKGPALVVAPATLLGNWRDEAAKFVPDLKVLVMHGSKRKNYFEVMATADVIITSYSLLDRDNARYREIEFGAAVLDEASAVKNPDTLAAKAVRKINAAARIAISGTPVENSVRDLWSIFQFLLPGYLGGREDFKNRYELPCATEAQSPESRAAMQRLRWRTEPFMLRRTKSLVAKDLPAKIESVVWCEPSALQKESYQAILRQGAAKVDELRQKSGADSARMQMLTVLLRLRQTCCDLRLLDDQLKKKSLAEVSGKLARLMELLGEAGRGGHRVLVFSQFTSMLALIRAELEKENIQHCYLDGATRDRSKEVDRFQNPSGPPVFLISLKAGGYGLTLTAADTVVLFDPWWNPAVEAQAADRIHRIGQTKPATIYKFITRDTVEEKILRLQEKKRSVIDAAMGESDDEARPMMNGLNEQEMLDLLS